MIGLEQAFPKEEEERPARLHVEINKIIGKLTQTYRGPTTVSEVPMAAERNAVQGRSPKRDLKQRSLERTFHKLNKLLAEGRFARADQYAAKHQKITPNSPVLYVFRAKAALLSGAPAEGLKTAQRVLEQWPTNEAASIVKAECYQALGRSKEAISCLESHLSCTESPQIRLALARTLMSARKYPTALEVLQTMLRAKADAPTLELIGVCFQELKRWPDAIASFELGIKLDPSHRENFRRRAFIAQAVEGSDPRPFYLQMLQSNPDDSYAKVFYLWASLKACDWDAFDKIAPENIEDLAADESITPWWLLSLVDSPRASLQLQRKRHAQRSRNLHLEKSGMEALPAQAADGRIRIGYFSNDFFDHATLRLFSGVLRHHDRSKFEIHAFDFGPRDELGNAALGYCEHIHCIHNLSDAETTALSRKVGLDIAVDLKGDTKGSRTELFMRRQAPVQINYLGYPGTMGGRCYDYIIADHTVIPHGCEKYYDEKVIRLPTCYLPVDERNRATLPPTRTELGLPENAVVLACFNNHYKFSRELFNIWLKALKVAPNAVLWLLDCDSDCKQNLINSFKKASINPDRLIFGEKLPFQAHITRLAQADLYLDTFNCNAHTLAAEALCAAHVPILTYAGEQFAARVGASFMTAAGVSELVCETHEKYSESLCQLAKNAQKLANLRGEIIQNRETHSLFLSSKYTTHLENGFRTAHNRARLGKSPKSFNVSSNDANGTTL